jgi:hypothetical protein
MVRKEELVSILQSHGEVAPKKWTVSEVTTRVLEVHGSLSRRKDRTPLQVATVELNKHRTPKLTLQTYLQQNLGLTISGHETIPILIAKAYNHFYSHVEVHAQDPVGFGKHCSLTYEELLGTDPQYIQWAIRTVEEDPGTTDVRLKRLVRWMSQQNEPTTPPLGTPKAGVPTQKAKPRIRPARAIPVPPEDDETPTPTMEQMMKEMMDLRKKLTENENEMQTLRTETAGTRRHKNSVSSSGGEQSLAGYSVVDGVPMKVDGDDSQTSSHTT